MKKILITAVIIVLVWGYIHLATSGYFGQRQTGGQITTMPRDAETVNAKKAVQAAVRKSLGIKKDKQILFGDLHAHTTFSSDAYIVSLPMYQGEGSHPPADACDFARYCSALDFWSINDHAESLTPYLWKEIKESVRQCNAMAGDPDNPDMVTFLGWEWTQIGRSPDKHYGHKNVVLLDTQDDKVPSRPIASRDTLFPSGKNPYGTFLRLLYIALGEGDKGRQPYYDFVRYLEDADDMKPCRKGINVRELTDDCHEVASTPSELFSKLDEWNYPYMVIPHGNTWGFYTPALSSWDKQLKNHTNPEKHEYLIEVFSGHGNIEEYRPWRAALQDEDGNLSCPEPNDDFLPECWQAGEIIHKRCLAAGESDEECEKRAQAARANNVAAGDQGYMTVSGTIVEDWLDAGQCRDCYMPAYNHRPGGSVQYALVLRDFSSSQGPKRFRFGMLGSSDGHTARPGTGYKEFKRRNMTDASLGLLGPPAFLKKKDPEPKSNPLTESTALGPYFERFASFFGTGGLVAVHSTGRNRQSIWDALKRKEVYGTSGDRILLWFNMLDGITAKAYPMGSSVTRRNSPRFEVKAAGAFEQKPGCPPDVIKKLSKDRLQNLCGGECYNPSDKRKKIVRIEVVRIRPQKFQGEPIEPLIEDPWRVLKCPENSPTCRVTFKDPEFSKDRRDTVYYVRAIEEASPTVNGGQLRCKKNENGDCIEVNPCFVSEQTDYSDDCLASKEERAWSSPIFVDYGEGGD